jgi:hypothetical protein
VGEDGRVFEDDGANEVRSSTCHADRRDSAKRVRDQYGRSVDLVFQQRDDVGGVVAKLVPGLWLRGFPVATQIYRVRVPGMRNEADLLRPLLPPATDAVDENDRIA